LTTKKTDSVLSLEEANNLVLENQGWAESIARSVARAWDLDWQQDGLDGAAMEAIIFCSRRYSPERGVPFRAYARKRIHEACCDAARKSKGWRKSGSSSEIQHSAREISMDLVDIFPELRSGYLPSGDGEGDERSGIRQLLASANLLASRNGITAASPEEISDYKRTVEYICILELIHQVLLWEVYWEGNSMRSLASEWETDELNVIREHKSLLEFLQKSIALGQAAKGVRVRPGLKDIALRMEHEGREAPFSALIEGSRR
jgi:hypothetical protein